MAQVAGILILLMAYSIQTFSQSRSRAIELNNAGVVQVNSGDFVEAQESFKEAITLEPHFAIAHYNLGTAYYYMGRFNESKAAFEAAIDIDPNYSAAFNQLGVVRVEIGEYEAARAAFIRASEIGPRNPNVLFNLGCLLIRMRDFPEAIKYLEQTLTQPGLHTGEASLNLAYAYAELKQYARAISIAKKTLEVIPSDREMRLLLVRLYIVTKDRSAAIAEYRKALISDRSLAPYIFGLIRENRVITASPITDRTIPPNNKK